MPIASVQPIFHLERGEHSNGRAMTDVTWFFRGYFLFFGMIMDRKYGGLRVQW